MTDDTLHQQIIEAGTLGCKLWQMEDGDEGLEQAGRAYAAALSRVRAASKLDPTMAVMMVTKLLDGKPYAITSDNPEAIRLCTALAVALGARVEHSNGHPAFSLEPRPDMRSIRVYPASTAQQ